MARLFPAFLLPDSGLSISIESAMTLNQNDVQNSLDNDGY